MNKKSSEERKIISHNLTLYATFYPKYYLLEANMKKGIYENIKRELGNDWFSEQISAVEPDSVFSAEIAAILRRKPNNFQLKDYGLLVESGLGFWVEFFNKRLYKSTKGVTMSLFPSRPKEIKRKDIYKKLDLVKNFRNELFHSRITIIQDPSQLQILDDLVEIDQTLTCLLTWMEVSGLPKNLSVTFEKEVHKIRQLVSAKPVNN